MGLEHQCLFDLGAKVNILPGTLASTAVFCTPSEAVSLTIANSGELLCKKFLQCSLYFANHERMSESMIVAS